MAKRKHNIEKRNREIGDRLKLRRLRHTHVTQETLAEELGIHYVSYGRIENGQAELTITKAECLANYYGISLDELVGFSSDSDQIPPIVQEGSPYYEKPKTANITIQVGGDGQNSPQADAFLKRLGKLLVSDMDDPEYSDFTDKEED